METVQQIPENYFIIEENLMLLHSMSENLRIVSSGISDENPSLEKALYGIARVIEGQIEEIETKLLNTNINTYNEKKGA